MKRLSAIILSAVLALFCLVSCEKNDREHTLKVYNWADYIDEDLLDEFEEWYEKQTGEKVKVIYQLFDINEVMLSKIEMGHDDYDVVCPSDYIIERMMRKDLLLPIDRNFGDTPDYTVNVAPFIHDLFDKIICSEGRNANDYAVGYMWGTTGFLYNTRFVDREELSSWGSLQNPKFAGMLFMKDAFRDIYSALLQYCRYEDICNGTVTRDSLMLDASDESIALVEDFLKSFKDNVSGWEADFGKEQMTKEKAWVNMSWSGDAEWSIEEAAEVGVPLDYVVPNEGSNVWFDGWVIPKYAVNVKAASYFINFMCMPENAVRNMDVIGYVSTIGGDYILDEMQDEEEYEAVDASYFFGEGADSVFLNPVMYPDKAVVDRCTLMHDSGDRTEALLAMWSRVKGDNATSFTYIIIIAAVSLLLAGGIRKRVLRARKKKRSNRKKYNENKRYLYN